MANFNKVILAGNLTRDPQLSYLPSGSAVCECGMAVNRQWRTPQGDKREEVCFVDFRIYGKPAETFNQYMNKGRQALLEGRLKYDQWERDGQKRSKLYVVVDNFQFLGGPQGDRGSAGGERGGYRQTGAPAPAPARSSTYSAINAGGEEMPPPMDEGDAGGNPDEPPF